MQADSPTPSATRGQHLRERLRNAEQRGGAAPEHRGTCKKRTAHGAIGESGQRHACEGEEQREAAAHQDTELLIARALDRP